MFSQDRKYFRLRASFHFSRVLILAFLLSSPTQAFNLPQGCAEVVSALIKNSSVDDLIQDPKLLMNVLDCLQGMYKLIRESNWKAIQVKIPKQVRDIIQNIPSLVEKAKPFATKGKLALLSLYLGYRGIELYEQAKSLEKDYRMHQNEFAKLKEKVHLLIDFIEKEIMPQLENGNTVNMPRKIEKLLEMLNRSSDVLTDLVRSIYKDTKRGSSQKIWSAACGVAVVGVCAGSVFTGHPAVIIASCGVGVGTAAVCYESYVSLGQTLEKLDLLWHETAQMSTVIARYRVILELEKLRDDTQ